MGRRAGEDKSVIHSTDMLLPYRCAHSACSNYDVLHLEMEGVAFEGSIGVE